MSRMLANHVSECVYGKVQRKSLTAHREGRTRSLQIHIRKSLTLYPIELGGP